MFKSNKIKPKDPPKITAIRVFLLTIPSAFFIITLVYLNYIELVIGLVGYLCILFVSLAIMAGFMSDLQTLVDYASDISEGKDATIPELMYHSAETMAIINSINKIHNVWSDKIDSNNLSISDSVILDTIPYSLLFIDDNLNVIGSNTHSHKMFGNNIRNKNIFTFIKGEDFERAFADINKGITKEIEFEHVILNPKQKYLNVKITKLPAKGKGGAVLMVCVDDITLQKIIEQKQIDFFANASHELKTPLSVISGFVETIQTSAKDDQEATSDFLKIIQNQADDMTNLINDLLVISRLETSIEDKDINEVNISEIINKTIVSLKIKCEEKSISFDFTDNPVHINANQNDIVQITRNLLDNAVKYGKENSLIKVKAQQIDKNIEMSVNNQTDSPIKKEDIEKITERFFRTDEVKAKKIPGTGLGLSIAKAIIINYNGNMNITSDNINGTTFKINLISKQT